MRTATISFSLPAMALATALLMLGAPLASAAPKNKPAQPARLHKVQNGSASDASSSYGQREDVMRFAQDLAERRGLDAAWVQAQLAQSRYLPLVAKLIMPPPVGTAKNWAAYRSRFVEPQRIRAGVAFWRANERWLVRAQEMYGVPAEIVVGILGVETLYGRNTGGFRVIDALATLAFDFPTGRRDRSGFFRDELEALFVLSASEKLDPLTLKGSYAGAIGLPQFMPSSWNRYAVDFDGDGTVNLHSSAADVIGSVANYLAEFGWQRGLPTHYEVTPPPEGDDRTVLLAPDITPSFDAAQMAAHGALLAPAGQAHEGLLALVELKNGDMLPSFVVGTQNFYVVTRYNWSSYYALAVIELGAEVARSYVRESTAGLLPDRTR